MRFFTPELYIRFNSADEDVADQADAEWERAVCEYQKHLQSIQGRMSVRVATLSQTCLHDAELIAADEQGEPFLEALTIPPMPGVSRLSTATLLLKHNARAVVLTYVLWDRTRKSLPSQEWPFSKEKTHWLYDEVDVVEQGLPALYLHRILLSDGRVLEFPFLDVVIHDSSCGGNTL